MSTTLLDDSCPGYGYAVSEVMLQRGVSVEYLMAGTGESRRVVLKTLKSVDMSVARVRAYALVLGVPVQLLASIAFGTGGMALGCEAAVREAWNYYRASQDVGAMSGVMNVWLRLPLAASETIDGRKWFRRQGRKELVFLPWNGQ